MSEANSNVVQPINSVLYAKAIEVGQQIYRDTGSKAQAARELYKVLVDEPREVVMQAFIEGASITPKGAPTYFYNIRKKLRRQARGG